MIVGVKNDFQKDAWHLLPLVATRLAIRVLMYGAEKYTRRATCEKKCWQSTLDRAEHLGDCPGDIVIIGAENWRHVQDGQTRYYDAALRHLTAWRDGEFLDDESGLPHLAHAIVSAMFALELAMKERGNE